MVEAAKEVYDADILCFLLNKMDEKQQCTALKKNICGTLGCFLDWPFQSLFIAATNRMWYFLKDKMYDHLLRDIVCKIEGGYKDWDYQELFRFWQESPSAKKSSITNEMHKSWLVIFLFRIKNKENIRLIFEHATLMMQKETLIYSDRMDVELATYIRNKEWDFLEFCIQECLASKSKILNLK